ncbi:hypothetical protein FOL47_007458 [Perkinsus chesapeaki]|uniref:Uncharacterized protein n=1 Tax=Perkinsus chesapeaki TaxID=330153 RepID=A0A7J6LKG2_PERCH|nr:hypothetical protein FOL47_007458 [Perkinsus chesapeaki]
MDAKSSMSEHGDPTVRPTFLDDSKAVVKEWMDNRHPKELGGFKTTWRPGGDPDDPSSSVPHKFRINYDFTDSTLGSQLWEDNVALGDMPYTYFVGNRFPTLSTAENYRYWKDRGIDRLMPRVFPIKLPEWRKLDPRFREYLFFLHSLDPARFTISRISERYGLRERDVRVAIKRYAAGYYLCRTGLTKLKDKQGDRSEKIEMAKEMAFAKHVGYDVVGQQGHDPESDDEFEGWRSLKDWVRQQSVEVESMSAFPMPAKREPMPKRVDIDMVVHNDMNEFLRLKVDGFLDMAVKLCEEKSLVRSVVNVANNHDYLQELGNLLANVAPQAGGDGVLLAFSSYAQLRTAIDYWASHDITNRLQQRGLRIFEEPMMMQFSQTLVLPYASKVVHRSSIIELQKFNFYDRTEREGGSSSRYTPWAYRTHLPTNGGRLVKKIVQRKLHQLREVQALIESACHPDYNGALDDVRFDQVAEKCEIKVR